MEDMRQTKANLLKRRRGYHRVTNSVIPKEFLLECVSPNDSAHFNDSERAQINFKNINTDLNYEDYPPKFENYSNDCSALSSPSNITLKPMTPTYKRLMLQIPIHEVLQNEIRAAINTAPASVRNRDDPQIHRRVESDRNMGPSWTSRNKLGSLTPRVCLQMDKVSKASS